MEVAEAYSLISHAIDTGHIANGYLIVGDLKGNAAELTQLILHKLFPDETDQVDAGSHPDVVTLSPQGKSRTIKVERGKEDSGPGMRDGMLEPMSVTAFSGGWKVGVIFSADRLQLAAANAFLKSLEEPTPRTLYLLLTDQPDAILPTIISRTQRVNLRLSHGILAGGDYEAFAVAFAAHDVAALTEQFANLKKSVEDEDVAQVRKTFFRTLMSFVRQMMLSGELPAYRAYRNIEAVETAYRRSERSLPDEAVLAGLVDALAFPEKSGGAA